MTWQPTLEDSLIHLRPLQLDDHSALYEVARDPLIWEQHPCRDRYRTKEFNAFFIESIDSGGALVVMDKEEDRLIGSSRFQYIVNIDYAVEIGWSFLARRFWGGRYNRHMKDLMLDYAFKWVDWVIFYIAPSNIRSQRAVEKIGGRQVSKEELKFAAGKGGNLIYGIHKAEWNKHR